MSRVIVLCHIGFCFYSKFTMLYNSQVWVLFFFHLVRENLEKRLQSTHIKFTWVGLFSSIRFCSWIFPPSHLHWIFSFISSTFGCYIMLFGNMIERISKLFEFFTKCFLQCVFFLKTVVTFTLGKDFGKYNIYIYDKYFIF